MSDSPKVRGVEVVEFWHDASELAPEPTIGFPVYTPGAKMRMNRNALRILTDVGVVGEYVGGAAIEYSTIPTMAPMLIGRNALEREGFYNDMKRVLRQSTAIGPRCGRHHPVGFCRQAGRQTDLSAAGRPRQAAPGVCEHQCG